MTEAKGEFERLAYEAALRGLDNQERLLEELRARTGVLLAAASIAASFLGQEAFQAPEQRVLVWAALIAFVTSIRDAGRHARGLPANDLHGGSVLAGE